VRGSCNTSGNEVATISDSGGGVFFKFAGERKMVVNWGEMR